MTNSLFSLLNYVMYIIGYRYRIWIRFPLWGW